MSNIMAAVAYLFGWLSGLIVYFISKDDKVARFHGMQAILFNIVYAVIYFVVAMIGLVLFFGLGMLNQPTIGMVLGFGVISVTGLLALLLMLWTMWQAFNDKVYKLPLIGGFAEKWSS